MSRKIRGPLLFHQWSYGRSVITSWLVSLVHTIKNDQQLASSLSAPSRSTTTKLWAELRLKHKAVADLVSVQSCLETLIAGKEKLCISWEQSNLAAASGQNGRY